MEIKNKRGENFEEWLENMKSNHSFPNMVLNLSEDKTEKFRKRFNKKYRNNG